MAGFLSKLFNPNRRELKRLNKIANKVDALATDMKELSDDQLRAKTDELKDRHKQGESLDNLLLKLMLL